MGRTALIIATLLCVAPAMPAGAQDEYWLDRPDLIIDAGRGVTARFDVEALPEEAQPILWIAARVVYNIEYRHSHVLYVEVNGRPVGLDRLAVGPKQYTEPCWPLYPTPSRDKCAPVESTDEATGETTTVPAWALRLDDNFILGESPFPPLAVARAAADGVEPSLALDLTDLVQAGENVLFMKNLIPDDQRPPVRFQPVPEEPVLPVGAVHARFVRLGLIGSTTIGEWNARHTRPYDPRPRTFGLRTDAGFSAMRRYYSEAAIQSADPRRSAFFRFLHGGYELWRGNPAQAEILLETGLSLDNTSDEAARALFLLGLAQLRQDRERAALATWDRLTREFPHSPWTAAAQRENVIRSWEGELRTPANWPYLIALRARAPVNVNGLLDEAAWEAAPLVVDFNLYPTRNGRPAVRTEARALYDDRAFYLSMVCFEPHMDEVTNPNVERDSPVWRDDCIELFLDPGRTYTQMYEFEVGADGGIVDCHNIIPVVMMNWDPEWRCAATKHADRWIVECAVPWQALECRPPRPGEVWLGNVVRHRPASENRPDAETSILGLNDAAFNAPEYAAMVLFW